MPDGVNPGNLLANLAHFHGGDVTYRHFLGVTYTEGVKYLCEQAGAYWLLDMVASYMPQIRRKHPDEEFFVARLKVREDRSAAFLMDTGHGSDEDPKEVVARQEIAWTDFPLEEVKLYVAAELVLLPSEY